MSMSANYVGCRICIYDENENNIENATISEHNRNTMSVTFRKQLSSDPVSGFVTVIILTSHGVYEYKGRLRCSPTEPMNMEVALFNGKEKESRTARRYVVNIKGVVEHMIINECQISMLNPLEVFIANLSTSGALIRTVPNCFSLKSYLELKLNIGDVTTPLQGKIVWVRDIDPTTCEYGYKFV